MKFDTRGMQAAGMSTSDINRNIAQATERAQAGRPVRSSTGGSRGVMSTAIKSSGKRKSSR